MAESFTPSIASTTDISTTFTIEPTLTITKPTTTIHEPINLNAIQILTMNHFEANQSEIRRPVKPKIRFKSSFLSIIDKQIIQQQIIKEQLKRLNKPNENNDEITCLTNLFEENVLNEFNIESNEEDKIELNMIEMVNQIWKQEQTNIVMTTSVFHETKPHQVSLVEINGRQCNVDFCILEGLLHDLILGLQFCTEYRVIINTYTRKITLGLEDNSLSLCEDIELPAYSSMKVGVKSKRHLSRIFWINGSKDLAMRFGIHVAAGKEAEVIQ